MEVTKDQLIHFANLDENYFYRESLLQIATKICDEIYGLGVSDLKVYDTNFTRALRENGCSHLISRFKARQIELLEL